MEKGLNKKKSLIKRMFEWFKGNNLKVMFLLIMGYFWWELAKDFRLEESPISSHNLPLGLILLFFGWMILKMVDAIKYEEDLETDIKHLTKDKLMYEREILKDKYHKLKNLQNPPK